MKHILEVSGIELRLGARQLLSEINIRCETGSVTGLLGSNGEGKSCLFQIIYGELSFVPRKLRLDGTVVDTVPGMLYLPQFSFVPGWLTIGRVLADYGLDFDAFSARFPEFRGMARTRFRELSGGLRRLIEVFIVLMAEAEIVLLDEPFSHLMPLQVEQLKELLKEEKARKGLIITDQLVQHVQEVSDRLYVLSGGKTNLINGDGSEIEKTYFRRV